MAESESKRTVVQAWARPEFAREIREIADRDGRSVSNLIRVVLEDRLETTSPTRRGPTPAGGGASGSSAAAAASETSKEADDG